MTEQEEQWKTCPDWPRYLVSTEGRILRCTKTPEEARKPIVNKKTGYCHTKLSRHSEELGKTEKRSMSIHRVVAETWIPNPEGKREVDHINRDKQDNRVENLRWVTRRENLAGVHWVKPVRAINLDTGEILDFDSIKEAAEHLGMFPQGINNVLKGYNKRYRRWRFEYILGKD
jgi:hypothetical protein